MMSDTSPEKTGPYGRSTPWAWIVGVMILGVALLLARHVLRLNGELDALRQGYLARWALDTQRQASAKRLRDPRYSSVSQHQLETDVAAQITLRTAAEVEERRGQLAAFLWPRDGFSDARLPDVVESNIRDARYRGFPEIGRIDRLTVNMAYGINSVILVFHPPQPGSTLVIYHAGHEETSKESWPLISQILDRGCSVMLINMPLEPPNSQPVVSLPRFGVFELYSHNQMAMLDDPMQFFFEPVMRSVNYAIRQMQVTDIHMVGFSGGGWTTTIYAAVDPRVRWSYPVAGSLPFYLVTNIEDGWGDFEQVHMPLYRLATHVELYCMGAHGQGRRQLQILNQFDEVVFRGIGSEMYLPVVRTAVNRLGPGSFDVYLDRSRFAHVLTPETIAVIMHDMGFD